MMELRGKTAVVTGAASGIGRALARRLAQEGMRLMLADIQEGPLRQLEQELLLSGAQVTARVTDVSSGEQVEQLASQTQASLGPVHLLVNNAGVTCHTGQALWEVPLCDWNWLLGVNLMGVVHGLRAFVASMLAHGQPAHIVNSVSYAGLVCGGGAYGATKHALISLTESLLFDLQQRQASIGVTCLCPWLVDTEIVQAERVRPERWRRPQPLEHPDWLAYRQQIAEATRLLGTPPESVAESIVEAVRSGQFYVLTEAWGDDVEERVRALQQGRPPQAPPRPSQSPRPSSSSA